MRTLAFTLFLACGCGRVLGADFDVSDEPRIVLGEPCGKPGALTCGSDRIVATCSSGEWRAAFECPKEERCRNQPDAQCIASGIDCHATKGARICVGTTAVECGQDGSVVATTDCPGPCVQDGQCRSVVDVVTGGSFTCAVLSDETAWCWGSNKSGQLGHAAHYLSDVPLAAVAPVTNLSGVTQLAAGRDFACARTHDQALHCWGSDTSSGSAVVDFLPHEIQLPSPAIDVVAADLTACVRMESGDVFCWGGNGSGQLCDPVQGSLPGGVVQAFAGATALDIGGADTCALLDGSLVCCGGTAYAGGKPAAFNWEPRELSFGETVETVAVGDEHICVVDSEGATYCWGDNLHGQLCAGHGPNAATPLVTFLKGTQSMRIGFSSTYALDAEGNLFCCGYVCGIPGLSDETSTPFLVLPSVTSVTNACAVFAGRALCWGANSSGRIDPNSQLTNMERPTLAGW